MNRWYCAECGMEMPLDGSDCKTLRCQEKAVAGAAELIANYPAHFGVET